MCRTRDREGLYAKADAGELSDVAGVTVPYEVPASPDIELDTAQLSVDQCVDALMRLLQSRGVL